MRREKYALLVNLVRAGCNRGVMDDDELIARLAGGDDAALRELFSRHAPWLAARLRALLPAPDVEDVLQETFLAVWRGAASYTPQGAAGRRPCRCSTTSQAARKTPSRPCSPGRNWPPR
jgi:antitoxin (DNA-binding transcriptional repressor) of toxin-antitoxin stability system